MLPEQLLDRISSIDNLRVAWIKIKHYALTEEPYYDAYAYDEFEEHLEANLAVLNYELLSRTYIPAPLRYLTIPKGDKVRKIYFVTPRDCVVMQAVMNIIGDHFEDIFSNSSCGNRLNVANRESQDIFARWQDQYAKYISHVRSFLNEGPDAWYLITDIANFYLRADSAWLTLFRQCIADINLAGTASAFLTRMAVVNDLRTP